MSGQSTTQPPGQAAVTDAILVAEVVSPSPYGSLPPRPPRRAKGMLLGCGAVAVLSLAVLCGGGAWMAYRATTGGSRIEVKPLSDERESIVAALDGKWHVQQGDPKYREIVQLLRELEAATASGDKQEFQKLVDWPAHMARYYRAYRHPLQFVERLQLDGIEKNDFTMPADASDFKIAAIDERREDEWYVFAYAQQGTQANAAYLFHVRKHKAGWKLVDHAEIGQMMWMAELNGGCAGRQFGDHRYASQQRFVELQDESDRLRDDGDQDGAMARLRKSEAEPGVPAARSLNHFHTALRWEYLGDLDEAQRVVRQIDDLDNLPYAWLLVARVEAARGNHVEALAAIDRFEHAAGFHLTAVEQRIESLAALERKQEASQQALRLVRYAPQSYQAISAGLSRVGESDFAHLLDALPIDDSVAKAWRDSARILLNRQAIDSHKALAEYFAKYYPGAQYAARMHAQRLEYEGEWEQAAAAYYAVAEAEDDPEERRLSLYEAVELELRYRSVSDVYRDSRDPRQIFALLTDDYYYDESLIDADDLAELLPLHREREPRDPRLAWCSALAARTKRDWPAAVVALRDAAAAFDPSGGLPYDEADLQSELLVARYRAGETIDPTQEEGDPQEVYRTLATAMESRGDWPALKALHERYPASPNDLWRRYYDLCLQLEEASPAKDAARHAELLQALLDLNQANAQSQTIYQFLLDSKIDQVSIDADRWESRLVERPRPQDFIATLINRFARDPRQARLENMLEHARQLHPDALALHRYELDRLWDAKDYAGYAAYHKKWVLDRPLKDDPMLGFISTERAVVSHLMLRDHTAAWTVATGTRGNAQHQWLVLIAGAKTSELRDFLRERRGDLYTPLELLETHRDVPTIASYVSTPEFAALRTESPLAIPSSFAGMGAVSFYADAEPLALDSIRKQLVGAGVDGLEIDELPSPPLASTTLRLRMKGCECLLVIGDRPFASEDDISDVEHDAGRRWRELASTSRHWLAVQPTQGFAHLHEDVWLKLLAALVPQSVGLWCSDEDSDTKWLAPTEQDLALIANDHRNLGGLLRATRFALWLQRDVGEIDDSQRKDVLHRCRKAAQQGTSPGRVLVPLQRGNAVEDLWLQVVAVKDEHWGLYRIEARAMADSELFPLLRKGHLVNVNPHDVRQWRDEPGASAP